MIADTKTGLSGAGRALDIKVHFSEADENVAPYGLDGHRHLPEMVQELGELAEAPQPRIAFVPHYTPMTRGILSTCYARAKDGKLVRRREGGPRRDHDALPRLLSRCAVRARQRHRAIDEARHGHELLRCASDA